MKQILLWCLLLSSSLVYAGKGYEIISGNAKQGGFLILKVEKNLKVVFKDIEITPDNRGRVLIAFSRDDKKNQSLKFIQQSGEVTHHPLRITDRKYKEQRINGLPKNKVTPDKKTSEQIWSEILKAKKARKIVLETPYFDSGFYWPAAGIVSGVYGSRRILNGKPKRPHFGIDIAADKGEPLYAPADGKITLHDDMVLSGKTIMIDHGYGLRSTLMHLSKIHVKIGYVVKKGQLVGEIGMTGRATGPHVHWGMSWHNIRLDPALSINNKTKLGDKISI